MRTTSSELRALAVDSAGPSLIQNLCRENASLILREYLESVGGRQQILDETETAVSQQSAKKRGRPAGSASGGTPANGKRTKRGSHPASQTPPASVSSKEWKPPAGSWEDDISYVDACHDETTGKLVVYLTWRNGHKTQHDLKVVYSRCPQQVRPQPIDDEQGRCLSNDYVRITDAEVLRAPCQDC